MSRTVNIYGHVIGIESVLLKIQAMDQGYSRPSALNFKGSSWSLEHFFSQ